MCELYIQIQNNDFHLLSVFITDCYWECVLRRLDVDRALAEFYKILNEIFRECVLKFKFYSNYKNLCCVIQKKNKKDKLRNV